MVRPADLPRPERAARLGIDRVDHRAIRLHIDDAVVDHHVLHARAAGVHVDLREPGAAQPVPSGFGLEQQLKP